MPFFVINLPTILIDSVSEKINQAISQQHNVTRVIIAHWQESIDIADRVIDLCSLCDIHNIEGAYKTSQRNKLNHLDNEK
jgi:ABC-type multidrug transport system fused ATPase/permease subunit